MELQQSTLAQNILIFVGFESNISKNLPKLIANAVQATISKILSTLPKLIGSDGKLYNNPSDFDCDIHPGCKDVYERIVEAMGLSRDNISATLIKYENWGNSSGQTVLKVLDVRRKLPAKREYTVCCGFGNNIDMTMLVLGRR